VNFLARILLPCLLSASACADCMSFDLAPKHIGETQCVSGKVVRVVAGNGGVHYLSFCDDYRICAFSVVIFSSDLKNLGDIQQLSGTQVEIRGEIKEYDGRAEIILDNARQLGGEGKRVSPLGRNFDVEERGHFSPGKFRPSRRRSYHKRQRVNLPVDIPEDVESR